MSNNNDMRGPAAPFPATIEQALRTQQGAGQARPNLAPPTSKFTTPEAREAEARRLHQWSDENGRNISAKSVALESVGEDGAHLRCEICLHVWTISTSRRPQDEDLRCPHGCNRRDFEPGGGMSNDGMQPA
jgi:hypothetical protein